MSDRVPDLASVVESKILNAVEDAIQEVDPGALVSGFVCMIRWTTADGISSWSMGTHPGQTVDQDLGLIRASEEMVLERFRKEWDLA